MRNLYRFILMVMLVIGFGCVGTMPTTQLLPEANESSGSPSATRPQEGAVSTPQAVTTNIKSSESTVASNCLPLTAEKSDQPLFIPKGHFMVTRIMKRCKTTDAAPGFEKGTMWTAMGFPCTGGPGRILWRGKYNDPDMVSFPLANTCPMEPKDQSTIKKIASEALGFGNDAAFGAFYPFAVQFWQWTDYKEADVGVNLEMRQNTHVAEVWKKLKAKERIKIKLFGRENSWVNDSDVLYIAEGTIGMAGNKNFDIKINSARAASEEEIANAKNTCLMVRTEKECAPVFNH